MAGRRKQDSPISLFFFQDIITSVSGVMIILMMLFAIVPPNPSSHAENQPVLPAEPTDRSEEMHQLRRRLLRLRQTESILLQADESARIATEIDAIKGDYKAVEEELKRVIDEVAKASQENIRIAKTLAAAKYELNDAANSRKIRFVPGEESGKTPVLVECAKEIFRCGILGSGKNPKTFTSLDDLATYAQSFSKTSHAFVFLIKPSSVEQALPAVYVIKGLGYEVGYDPFEEVNSVEF